MIEIHKHNASGYKRLVEFGSWTAAQLNNSEKTDVDTVMYLQKHNLTDEVFILLSGKCMLVEAGDGAQPGEIHGVWMEPYRFYNMKAGVWHTHILAQDTGVVVVENNDTGPSNSPIVDLTPEQKERIRALWEQKA